MEHAFPAPGNDPRYRDLSQEMFSALDGLGSSCERCPSASESFSSLKQCTQLSEASRADLGLWSLLGCGGFLALSPTCCVNLEQFCNFPEGIPDPPVLGREIRTPPCGLFPDEW